MNPAKKHKARHALLWSVTRKDAPVSYLFGTMHVQDLRAFTWLEQARQRLAECEIFATEFDFEEVDPVALSQALTLPEESDLKNLLPPRAWRNLEHYSRRYLEMDAEVFRFQHPMSVSTALSLSQLSREASHSLDETLWMYARALGIPTTGVESFEDQLETLRSIPFEQHLQGLTYLLKNFKNHRQRLKRMMQRYANAEIQALHKAAKKDAKGMRKILLYRRNRLMAQRFAELASGQSLFCAIGAGHLAGGKGMLRLLKQAGFKVRPVPNVPLNFDPSKRPGAHQES